MLSGIRGGEVQPHLGASRSLPEDVTQSMNPSSRGESRKAMRITGPRGGVHYSVAAGTAPRGDGNVQ